MEGLAQVIQTATLRAPGIESSRGMTSTETYQGKKTMTKKEIKEKLLKEKEERDRKLIEGNKLKVERANNMIGHLNEKDGIDCPVCKSRGYIARLDEDPTDEPVRVECRCMEKRRIVANANRSGLGAMLGKKLSDYQVKESWQAEVKQHMQEYMKNPQGWFVIDGVPGSGKTLACMIVANQLLRDGKLVQFVSWPELVREASVDFYKEKDVLQKYKTVEVLYIDDFLKVADQPQAMKIAYEILNYRYAHESLTIISGERKLKEIVNIDGALAGRIFERAGSHLIELGNNPDRNQRMKG